MFQNAFDSPSRYYTLYYDESNNHRKFYINAGDSSYNVDNDAARKQAAGTSFILAGVAHKGRTFSANTQELFESLKLQKSAKELKFGQVASGTFGASLKSARLKTLLKWVLESDLYLHFFVLNMEYWAFIDIIEDCTLHCIQKGRLTFADIVHFRQYLDFHKDAIYRLLRLEKKKFLGLARSFGYPRIAGREKTFVSALHSLVSDHAIRLLTVRSDSEKQDANRRDILQFLSLAELLSICDDIEDMALTEDLDEGALIDGFAHFYHHRSSMFSHSEHVFDDEFSVEGELSALRQSGTQPALKCKFVRSDDSPLMQVSDVIAGLFSKYFDFLEKNTSDELMFARAALTPLQLEALNLMKSLIEKSHAECEHLLYYVTAASVHEKHRQFMFPGEW